MFAENERAIMEALLEEEIVRVSDFDAENDYLLKKYYYSLAKILMKIKLNAPEMLNEDYIQFLREDLASRQAV
jgi:hypothetical protein